MRWVDGSDGEVWERVSLFSCILTAVFSQAWSMKPEIRDDDKFQQSLPLYFPFIWLIKFKLAFKVNQPWVTHVGSNMLI